MESQNTNASESAEKLSTYRKAINWLDDNNSWIKPVIEFLGIPAVLTALYHFFKASMVTGVNMNPSVWNAIAFVFFAWVLVFFIRFIAKHSSDKEISKNLKDLDTSIKGLSTDVKNLVQEIRQDRNERSKKPKSDTEHFQSVL